MASQSGRFERFPTTHWSLVVRAGQDDQLAKRDALEHLLTCYVPALRTHLILTRRVRPADAADVVQQFVADKILQRDLIARADQRLGKFRTFLLVSLDRFYFNQVRGERTKKRTPGDAGVDVSNDRVDLLAEPHASDPFDLAWAQNIIEEALEEMREECDRLGRADVWGVFQCRLADPILQGGPAVEYTQLVARFDLKSPAQAANVLVTGKRMFARFLRNEIGRYACNSDEIDAEIDELYQILARCGGRS